MKFQDTFETCNRSFIIVFAICMTVPLNSVNPIQSGPFRGCSWMRDRKAPSIKSVTLSYNGETWHTYTIPKEDPKNIWITCHTLWVLLTSTFFENGYNFDDASKIATLGLFKIKLFWNKGYDVLISVHDVTNKILLRDSILL